MHRIPRFPRDVRGAWEMLLDFPLPEALAKGEDSTENSGMLPYFPLLGALCGVVIAVLGMLAAVLTNPVAGAAAFALISLAFLTLKDSGRGILLIVSLLDRRPARGSFVDALPDASPDRAILSDTRFGAVAAAAILILEFIVLFLLGSRNSAFFIVTVLAGSFTVQGMLASGDAENGATPIRDEEGTGRGRMLIAAVAVALVMLWRFPVATAFSVAVFCLVAFGFSGAVRRRFDAVTPDMVTLAGALTETGLLVCGFLWAL